VLILKRWGDKPSKTGAEVERVAIFIWKISSAQRTDNMTYVTFEMIIIDRNRQTITVRIPRTKTSGHHEITFCANNNHTFMSPYHLILAYIEMIPEQDRVGRLWRLWNESKSSFHTRRFLGKGAIAQSMIKILEPCLDILRQEIQDEETLGHLIASQDQKSRFGIHRYTGHTPRRSVATIWQVIDTLTDQELMDLGRWKNPKTMKRYQENNYTKRVHVQNKFATALSNIYEHVSQENIGSVSALSDAANGANEDRPFAPVFNNCTFN
jgi:hypothetical protein